MDINELKEKCKEFEELEKRGSFYDMAINLVDKGFELEGIVLILATWNTRRFRYFVKNGILDLKSVLEECNLYFDNLKNEKFDGTDFDRISKEVKDVYNCLSKIKGIEYTGASKVMHLKNKNLFVMWDMRIRKEYGFNESADDYLKFLKFMQGKFRDIRWDYKEKTLAKAIDEYNYVTITLNRK